MANTGASLRVDAFTGTLATVGLMGALVAAMVGREQRLQLRLAEAAERDPLTGVLNRRAFNPRLEELAIAAGAFRSRLSVVMIDLNHFKRINDTLVGRFGGEEFAVAPGHESGGRAQVCRERCGHVGRGRLKRELRALGERRYRVHHVVGRIG